MIPELLPAFVLKGGEVSRFVIGGADLMFPGINVPPEGLPSFVAGEPWAVKVPGNPAPIAVISLPCFFRIGDMCKIMVIVHVAFVFMKVGSTTMSSNEALKAGLRGKALRITHYYRDLLWQV